MFFFREMKLVMLLTITLLFIMISSDIFAGSADAIQLEGLTTKRPRITKYSKNTSANAVSSSSKPKTSGTFRVVASNGATCILLKVDALISISYITLTGEMLEIDLYIPDDAKVEGVCQNEDDESMTISFKGFTMEWYFAKTPGGERWYVDSIRLVYNTSLPKFEHSRLRNARVQLGTGARRALLFPTPVSKSYSCSQRETKVELDNLDLDTYVDHNSTLYLREFQLQAFMYKAGNSFGPRFECSAEGSVRSEAAPIAVGATLAVAVLLTVVGYSVWRYVTVKKVEYDTME